MTCFPCHAIVTLLSTYNCVAVNCFKLTSYFFRPSNCLRLIDNVFYCKAAFETVLILTKFKQNLNKKIIPFVVFIIMNALMCPHAACILCFLVCFSRTEIFKVN